MPVDHIRYDILAQDALRGVVRTVLIDAAKNGLPGDHHFFITFDTGAAGVEMSPRMRAQYPAEMTVVLQHQFWDLEVSDERFSVGLSFGGVAEKLSIPFTAIKGFADPSVKFALQFAEVTEAAELPAAEGEAAAKAKESEAPAAKAKERGAGPRLPAEQRSSPPIAAVPTPPVVVAPDDGPDKPSGSGEVVRLDRFRKK